MALVSYSDSEASDSESELQKNTPAPATATATATTTTTTTTPKPTSSSTSSTAPFQSLIDRTNPRKIRVALPELKPETPDVDDEPARKKPRIGGGGGGGGGGAFAGFNSFLPAPKRPNAAAPEMKNKTAGSAAPTRKVFSLKTGATPGFDREADAEMRRDMAFGVGDGDDDETIPKAGSLRGDGGYADRDGDGDATEGLEEKKKKKPQEVTLKGNPMMFKPLSVGRTQQQKKKKKVVSVGAGSAPAPLAKRSNDGEGPQPQTAPATAPVPKPKVSLFSLSSEESTTGNDSTQAHSAVYEPLVYTANEDAVSAGPMPETGTEPASATSSRQTAPPSAQTLDYIADDLNLSRSQRRQLFGRNADPSKSRILHFNTDQEYAANQALAHETDLAAAQHNPVRAIAPGKHTLQQLVNAASSQRDALEESFASGKRNKKEAGAKYGW